MRTVLRIIGTWLIGLALVLLVIDGTKSLAANAIVMTSLGDGWTAIHPGSIEAVSAFFSSRLFADLLASLFASLLTYPAFAVIGVPGIVLALLGRRPRSQRFLRTEEI
ncbi:hypothetical protein SAMN05216456_3628 [Devosia crocina]|uniref:Uncharacterized protein n=1 Tax=Devosia crocina TaxID=429728 RepID=A0A1I7NVW5_9HYPH|nr:hypothetical protein [Devosia crocina]SFV38807.1 hypothetical protein SAMN05216456_3628 [Devosia crocina]